MVALNKSRRLSHSKFPSQVFRFARCSRCRLLRSDTNSHIAVDISVLLDRHRDMVDTRCRVHTVAIRLPQVATVATVLPQVATAATLQVTVAHTPHLSGE